MYPWLASPIYTIPLLKKLREFIHINAIVLLGIHGNCNSK